MMQPHLIFGLHASLGAMGELAGHERRGSLLWPARSALIGLMGAALGIQRDGDFSVLEELEIEVALFDAGRFMRDYHTVEAVPSAAVKNANSRPEALRIATKLNTNTTITYRDYRTDPFYGVAVRGAGLETIKTALNTPKFTLYFGRKSCPLSAPLGAKVVEASDSIGALQHLVLPPWRKQAVAKTLIVEDPLGEAIHDRAIDRNLWHFSARFVAQKPISLKLGDSDDAVV